MSAPVTRSLYRHLFRRCQRLEAGIAAELQRPLLQTLRLHTQWRLEKTLKHQGSYKKGDKWRLSERRKFIQQLDQAIARLPAADSATAHVDDESEHRSNFDLVSILRTAFKRNATPASLTWRPERKNAKLDEAFAMMRWAQSNHDTLMQFQRSDRLFNQATQMHHKLKQQQSNSELRIEDAAVLLSQLLCRSSASKATESQDSNYHKDSSLESSQSDSNLHRHVSLRASQRQDAFEESQIAIDLNSELDRLAKAVLDSLTQSPLASQVSNHDSLEANNTATMSNEFTKLHAINATIFGAEHHKLLMNLLHSTSEQQESPHDESESQQNTIQEKLAKLTTPLLSSSLAHWVRSSGFGQWLRARGFNSELEFDLMRDTSIHDALFSQHHRAHPNVLALIYLAVARRCGVRNVRPCILNGRLYVKFQEFVSNSTPAAVAAAAAESESESQRNTEQQSEGQFSFVQHTRIIHFPFSLIHAPPYVTHAPDNVQFTRPIVSVVPHDSETHRQLQQRTEQHIQSRVQHALTQSNDAKIDTSADAQAALVASPLSNALLHHAPDLCADIAPIAVRPADVASHDQSREAKHRQDATDSERSKSDPHSNDDLYPSHKRAALQALSAQESAGGHSSSIAATAPAAHSESDHDAESEPDSESHDSDAAQDTSAPSVSFQADDVVPADAIRSKPTFTAASLDEVLEKSTQHATVRVGAAQVSSSLSASAEKNDASAQLTTATKREIASQVVNAHRRMKQMGSVNSAQNSRNRQRALVLETVARQLSAEADMSAVWLVPLRSLFFNLQSESEPMSALLILRLMNRLAPDDAGVAELNKRYAASSSSLQL